MKTKIGPIDYNPATGAISEILTVNGDRSGGTRHSILGWTGLGYSYLSREARDARGALFAAAPTLLAALREAHPVLEALQAAHPLPMHDSAVGHGKALRLVREALAQIKGG